MRRFQPLWLVLLTLAACETDEAAPDDTDTDASGETDRPDTDDSDTEDDTDTDTDDGPGNTPPVAANVTLSPADARVGDAITAAATTSDADGDTVTLAWAWTIDSTPVSDVSTDTLPAGRALRGQSVVATATPTDGTEDGTPVSSAPLIVANTPPTVASVGVVTSPARSDSDLLCEATGVDDVDEDPVTLTWIFEVGPLEVQRGPSDTLPAALLNAYDSVRCGVVPRDGIEAGAEVWSTAVVVVNSPPSVTEVTLSPSPAGVTDTLTATAAVVDADGDVASLAWRWTVDGVDAASTTDTLDLSSVSRGQEVVAWALPSDAASPLGSGVEVGSAALVVANTVPEVGTPVLSPSPARTGDVLTAAVDVSDADGDVPSTAWTWTVDGIVQVGATSDTLPAGTAVGGQAVVAEVVVDDGHGGLVTRQSAALVLSNTPPSVPGVEVSPETPRVGQDDMVCARTLDASDADGDALQYALVWRHEGTAWTGATATTTTPGDTILADDLLPGTWTCEITADDGADEGPTASDSAEVPSPYVPPALIDVAAGVARTCVLREDGRPRCWGSGTSGHDDVPDVALTSIHLARTFACGLDTNSEAVCWGSGIGGTPSGAFAQLTVGDYHVCGRRPDGTVTCWGQNSQGQGNVPTGSFLDIDAEDNVTCGIQGREVLCWGNGAPAGRDEGADVSEVHVMDEGYCVRFTLSDGLYCRESNVPSWGNGAYADIRGGHDTLCVLLADRSISCVGDDIPNLDTLPPAWAWDKSINFAIALDEDGAFHATTESLSNGILKPPVEHGIVQTVGANSHVCWQEESGSWDCAGRGLWDNHEIPVGIDFAKVDMGWDVACGLVSDGSLRCWGLAFNPSGGPWVDVSVGRDTACAVAEDRSVSCWFEDSGGESTPPVGLLADHVSVGKDQACSLDDTTGAITCWGTAAVAQLTPPTGPFVAVSAGDEVTCGHRPSGEVSCWGAWNDGDPLPTISGTFDEIAAGDNLICGVRPGGTLECFAGDFQTGRNPPAGAGFSALDVDRRTACARGPEGGLWCWGYIGRRPL